MAVRLTRTNPDAQPADLLHTANVIVIRDEQPQDHQRVCDVNALAFDDPHHVPDLVRALRKTPDPLSFVAVDDEEIIGHVMLSACRLDAPPRLVDVMSLSPLAVLPDRQRQGIGKQLIEHALKAADERGVPLVFLEGDPRYYSKRGFETASKFDFRSPSLRIPDSCFQVVRLSTYESWMTGTFVYSEPFWALDCVGLRP